MLIAEIIQFLEKIAPPALQEDYDNAGLITGKQTTLCSGAIISLDCTEAIVQEAIDKKYNLIIAHHPIIFKGLKKINGNNYVERTIIKAIKNDIAIYAIHTNLDNIKEGVNGKIAQLVGLQNIKVLAPKNNMLQKLVVFIPTSHVDTLANALYAAGAGNIGNYKDCSFSSQGIGSFTALTGAQPFVGELNINERVAETKLEVVFPKWLQKSILTAMRANHRYEEIAYDIIDLNNYYQNVGSGIIGELPTPISEVELCTFLGNIFNLKMLRHSRFTGRKIEKIALCGGTGSFLIQKAKAAGADVFITADLKYHEFFDADGQLLLIDIGHFESEQYTIDLLFELLSENFPNFAVLKTSVNTNSVEYFVL